MSEAKIYEIKDRAGESCDFIVADSPESALQYFAVEFHGYDSVRTCKLDDLIDDASPRELTDEELDTLERTNDEDVPVTQLFREGLASDLGQGFTLPFYFSSVEQ